MDENKGAFMLRQWVTGCFVLVCAGSTILTGCGAKSSKDPKQQTAEASHIEMKGQQAERETPVDHKQAALANVELGLGYLSQGQVARAKAKLTHAIKLAPEMPEAHSAMAYFFEMVGENKDAEKEYKKALKYGVGKGAVYNNYGAFLCRKERFQEADSAFHQALLDKDYTRTAEVYENAGLCALKWKDNTKALEKGSDYFWASLRHDPNRSSALLELAAIQLTQGKPQEAKALLSRYKNVAEPSARSLWLSVQAAKATQDKDAFANHAMLLKNLFQDSPEYQLFMKSEKGNP